MKKRSSKGNNGNKPPSDVPPRPYAPQFTPLDYQGEALKLSKEEIAKIARREGEVLKAQRTELLETKEVVLAAKQKIEPCPVKEQVSQVKQAQAPPQPRQTTPAAKTPAQDQQKETYQFSDKAKEFFAKFIPKKKEEPQKEQEQIKDKSNKPRER